MFALILFSLFSDHLVLQRGRANPVWGTDTPAQTVTLKIEGSRTPTAEVSAVAGPDGKWILACPALPAGGPYRLHFHGSTDRVIDDVWVGDVWLASGQSNMEFPLNRARDAAKEITAANFPEIRFAKVARTVADSPATNANVGWEVCTPKNAGQFTAVGYFFAREIFETEHVPIGIIDSTWGGTPVEAWVSHDGLQPVMPANELDRPKVSAEELNKIRADYAAQMHAWELKVFPQDTENLGEKNGWAKPDFDDHGWRRIDVPNTIQSQGLKANGAFWLRRDVTVPPEWSGRDLTLDLGAIDDFDTTYFNGERVGATGPETPDAYQALRHYRVPGRLVHAGKNVIAVRVFDRFGEGGLLGPSTSMSLSEGDDSSAHLDLSGPWSWTVEREIPLVSSDIFGSQPQMPPQLSGPGSPTVLFNGMIAPIIPYGIRGYIWYQGEANTWNYASYRDRFTALIRDWRTRWGEGNLPFYFVQLAGYHESSKWPYLREAQSETRSEPNTGMAVAFDIGNPRDIHPTDKQDVGDRLARLARARTYGDRSALDAGPSLATVTFDANRAIILWNHVDRLHTSDGKAEVLGFELAGADKIYHPARARIERDEVIAESADVPRPISVRYAWADYTEVNLVNAANLPAEPFRTDNYPPK